MKKLLLISLAMVLVLTGCSARPKTLKPDEAKEKAETFINAVLMAPGSQAIVKEIEKMDGFYKMQVDVGSGEPIESYLSLDGKLFFPQALDIDAILPSILKALESNNPANRYLIHKNKRLVKLIATLFPSKWLDYLINKNLVYKV